ncbi:MAG: tetratricopeptide repeat protein, partial [Gemmatimonadetes bacterium]|nr:tetratricopeptide repeat protein [Gemmatimonadota bacterium]
LKKLINRHKLRFVVACAALALVTFSTVAMTILYASASSAERRAQQARRLAEREASTVTAIKEFLVDDLFESASPKVARGEDVTVKEVLQNASQRVRAAFDDQPELKAAILSTLGSVHLSLGLYTQAEEQLREAHRIFGAELGASDVETLRNTSLLVQAIQLGGDLTAACALGEDRLAAARGVLGNDHEVTLDIAAALTVVYALLSRLDDAAELAQETLARRRNLLGDGHPDAQVAGGSGVFCRRVGDASGL